MFGNSPEVVSNQDGPHPNLAEVVSRHLLTQWQAPVAAHTQQAFQQAARWRAEQGSARPLILDSGCGTGRSSIWLAGQHPDALVIGLDQSADRLRRGSARFAPLPPNLLLLRAEAAGFWRLMAAAGWRLQAHWLCYPNPWPKSAHLRRRWHGHPAFPVLLSLGGELRLRSNWALYLQEMHQALAIAGVQSVIRPLPGNIEPITDFEQKYLASGHRLVELVAVTTSAIFIDGADATAAQADPAPSAR